MFSKSGTPLKVLLTTYGKSIRNRLMFFRRIIDQLLEKERRKT